MGEPRYKPPKRPGSNLLPLLLIAVVVVLLVIWLGTAVTVGDVLWFIPVFGEKAQVVVLYWDGQQLSLYPGTPEYDQIHEALLAELPHVQAMATTAGLSDETLDQLRREGRLLELYYEQPVRIHSGYQFGASKVFYIPLSGHHSERNRVFNQGRGAPLELRSTARILAAAESIARSRGWE